MFCINLVQYFFLGHRKVDSDLAILHEGEVVTDLAILYEDNVLIFDRRDFLGGSVADPGCLSRILIFTHPGYRIPDLGSRIQKQ